MGEYHQKYVEGDFEFMVPSEEYPDRKREANWKDVFDKYAQELYEIYHPEFLLQEGQHPRKTPVIFGRMVERKPTDWNERFNSFLRLNKFGIVGTPSEENGHGPIHVRREVVSVERDEGTSQGASPTYRYVAKYLRTGRLIDSPSDLPRDGNSYMKYIIVPYVPQAYEDCVTMIGAVFGKGVWSHITAFQVRKRELSQEDRDDEYKSGSTPKPWDVAEDGTDSDKETVDEANIPWAKADRRDLRHGLDPRIVPYGIPKSILNVEREWAPEGSKILKKLGSSSHASGKNFNRFNNQVLVIELFRVKKTNNSYYSELPAEQTFVKSVELFNNCILPLNQGFCEKNPTYNHVVKDKVSKIESISKQILSFMATREVGGWPT